LSHLRAPTSNTNGSAALAFGPKLKEFAFGRAERPLDSGDEIKTIIPTTGKCSALSASPSPNAASGRQHPARPAIMRKKERLSFQNRPTHGPNPKQRTAKSLTEQQRRRISHQYGRGVGSLTDAALCLAKRSSGSGPSSPDRGTASWGCDQGWRRGQRGGGQRQGRAGPRRRCGGALADVQPGASCMTLSPMLIRVLPEPASGRRPRRPLSVRSHQ
jgi:hypothetical protein